MSVVKVKSTLLFLTSTFNELIQNSRNLLEHSFKLTQSNLFIYVAPTLPPIVSVDKSRPQLRRLFGEFYVNSLKYDQRVNVVCLLNNLPTGSRPVKSNLEYDLVLTDFQLSDDLEQSIRSHLKSNFVKFDVEMRSIEPLLQRSESFKSIELPNRENDLIAQEKTYRNSIIGGTFDRIHIGHKLLLTEALLLTSERLLIGLADGPLLVKKKLTDLIEDVSIREHHLRDLIAQMRPDLELVVEPIHDPYGPSITEPDYQCLIVSDETRTGGDAVNTKRVENGLNRLDLHVIALAQENALDPGDESKVSSSNIRRHLLGELLKPPNYGASASQPYLIGLTGGLASGKSAILNDLSRLGAGVIDCDKLGHRVYEKDTPGYHKLIETFGSGILAADGAIDRKELGKLVFEASDRSGLKKLTDIVWPEVRRMVEIETRELHARGYKVVVVEAPLLIEANWAHSMNEVWVVFVPYEEALKRAMNRDGSDEAKVKGTLNSQLSNKERIRNAHVVFSSIWEREYTIKQVVKAWDSLQQRIN